MPKKEPKPSIDLAARCSCTHSYASHAQDTTKAIDGGFVYAGACIAALCECGMYVPGVSAGGGGVGERAVA